MLEILKVAEQVARVGVPIVLSVLFIIAAYMLITKAPKACREYLDSRKCNDDELRLNQKNLQDQLFKQLEVITAVAQQGIEAQKRGNVVIEQNTQAFNTYQKVSEQMISSIIDLKDSINLVQDEVKGNSILANTIYTELVRVGERVK